MMSFTRLSLYLLLMLNLTEPVSLCQDRDKPLLLTPYLDRHEVGKARSLSQVERSCVEDFVPDSFAGFLTTYKKLGNHLFFWFFPSTQNTNAPLLLWLNGGPTVSSMVGLFWEHGPMNIDTEGKSDSGYTKREYSWFGLFSMLYVDNPVGVGFSYSDNKSQIFNVTQKEYTRNLVSFVQQFFVLFPEHKANDFYVAGQSYAGKYVPALTYQIHVDIQAGISDINLRGMCLGAPFYDPLVMSAAHYDYMYALGVISHKQMQDAKQTITSLFADAVVTTDNLSTSDLMGALFKFVTHGTGDNYVTRQLVNFTKITELLSKSKLKRTVHAGKLPFSATNFELKEAFGKDFVVSTKSQVAEVLNNYKVLIFNGDYDVVINTPMIEAALLTTPWVGQNDYEQSMRKFWTRGNEVIGYYSFTDNFCRVVLHGSGHQVAHDVPSASLLMMQQFVQDGCVSSVDKVKLPPASTSSVSIFLHKYNIVWLCILILYEINVFT